MSQHEVKVKLNRAGVGQILKSESLQAVLLSHAKRIAGSKGNARVYVAGTRAVGEASGKNKDNDMLKRLT